MGAVGVWRVRTHSRKFCTCRSVAQPKPLASFHLTRWFSADERSVRWRAGHRLNPLSKVTSEYESASAKAARYASVQELGPTPDWVMSWRQTKSRWSGSVAKASLRSARNCPKVSQAWTIVLGARPITKEFVNRRSRPIWVIRQKATEASDCAANHSRAGKW